MLKWLLVAASVLGLVSVLYADAKDDLGRAQREHESLKTKTSDLKELVDRNLEQSRNLRSMDKEQLSGLVDKICRLDITPNDREVLSIAKDMTEKVVELVRREYDRTSETAGRLVEQIARHLNDVKALRDRAKELRSQNEIKDDASRLADEAERLVEAVDKLMEKIQTDWKTLDRVKEGVMSGANNPIIRAKMEYGKEKHIALQSSRGCDEREVVLSSGRPDCIKFEQDNCRIIEFKPDTYSESAARDQAARYLDDVRRKFKDDDRARKCKQKDGYPDFTPVGETYTACRS